MNLQKIEPTNTTSLKFHYFNSKDLEPVLAGYEAYCHTTEYLNTTKIIFSGVAAYFYDSSNNLISYRSNDPYCSFSYPTTKIGSRDSGNKFISLAANLLENKSVHEVTIEIFYDV